ncbi:RNA-binding domain-containing protein, partial [Ascobolus immersus RN42]
PYDPANLHVKNLDDTRITNTEDLKNLFAGYGQIASAVLVAYPNSGISKGFGFVAFTTPADAAKAKANLNGMVVGRKPIVINYAERKEDRRQRLKAIF